MLVLESWVARYLWMLSKITMVEMAEGMTVEGTAAVAITVEEMVAEVTLAAEMMEEVVTSKL